MASQPQTGGPLTAPTPFFNHVTLPNAQNPGLSQFQDVAANTNQQSSLASFDKAAGRLRERIGQVANQQRQQARFGQQAVGFGRSGLLNQQLQDVNRQELGAFGQGINQLADQFEQRRLQSLGLQNQAAQGLSGAFLTSQQQLLSALQGNQAADVSQANILSSEKIAGEDAMARLLGALATGNVKLDSLDEEKIGSAFESILALFGL